MSDSGDESANPLFSKAHLEKGDVRKSIEYLEKALKLNPRRLENTLTFYALITNCREQGQADLTEEEIRLQSIKRIESIYLSAGMETGEYAMHFAELGRRHAKAIELSDARALSEYGLQLVRDASAKTGFEDASRSYAFVHSQLVLSTIDKIEGDDHQSEARIHSAAAIIENNIGLDRFINGTDEECLFIIQASSSGYDYFDTVYQDCMSEASAINVPILKMDYMSPGRISRASLN